MYFKYIYRNKILDSKPVQCVEEDFEIHILTSKRDILDALWCLKTFYFYSGLRPKLIVHEDCSFGVNEVNLIKKHFINSEVILRKRADTELKKYLDKYPFCYRYRYDNFGVHSLKLFDFQFYARKRNMIMSRFMKPLWKKQQ